MNIKDVLLDGKKQLLELKRKEDEETKKVAERHLMIKTRLDSYFDERTEEFVSNLLRGLIKERFKYNNDKIYSVAFNSNFIEDYFNMSKGNDVYDHILNEVFEKIAVRPDWEPKYAFSQDQLFAIAYYCGYIQFRVFAGIYYIINDKLFFNMINELGIRIEKDDDENINKLSITKEKLDKLLMSVDEEKDKTLTKRK